MRKIKSFYAQLRGIFRIVVFFFLVCSFLLFVWGSVVINKQLQENAKTELLLFAKNCDYIFDSVFSGSISIKDYIEDNCKDSLRNGGGLDGNNVEGFIGSQCDICIR